MATQWQCSNCTFIQNHSGNICDLCNQSRVKSVEQMDEKQASINEWQCPQCTLIQQISAMCRICGYKCTTAMDSRQDKHNDYHDIVTQLNAMGYSEERCGAAYLKMLDDNRFANIHNITQWLIDNDEGNEFKVSKEESKKLKCEVSVCASLQRLCTILKFYNETIVATNNEEKSNKSVQNIYEYLTDKFWNGQYSDVALLNDFHHLLFDHEEFEELHDVFAGDMALCKVCDKKTCSLLARNHRDRFHCSLDDSIRKKLYYETDHTQEINIHQLIDEIHCYFMH
eukprot:181267_1